MKPRPLFLALAWSGVAALALADIPPTPVQNILFGARGPADLRARLRVHADSSAHSAPLDAAEAWYFLGVSEARAGRPDSALAAFRRALAARNNDEDILAVADQLLAHEGAATAESALVQLRGLPAPSLGDVSPSGAEMRLRLAWAAARAGRPEAARAVWTEPRGELVAPRLQLPDRPTWAVRFAPIAAALGDSEATWRLAAPAAVLSRGYEVKTTALARAASGGHTGGLSFEAWLSAAIARADSDEARPFAALGVRTFEVIADDGLRLFGGAVPARPRAPLALIVPPLEATSLAPFDSLVAQLHRAGIAVAWFDPRGVRRSARPGWALPRAWDGREESYALRTARDAAAAIPAAARAAGADPSRVLVVGAGTSAVPAALAGERSPQVRALLIAGANPAAVDRGWLRETLLRSDLPVFFQTGPEDIYGNEALDRVVALLPAQRVRVADSQAPGEGAALFRAGAATARRFSGWLADAWSVRRAAPPATRPARRRRG